MQKKIAQYLDTTLLKKEANRKEILQLVEEAKKYRVAGVCVQPGWANLVKTKLEGTGIKTIFVPNWRMGGGLKETEIDMLKACKDDADEIDYVINIYEMYELKRWERVEKELEFVRNNSKILKVIIEAAYIHYNHFDERVKLIKQVIQLCNKYRVDYIKTDSGIFKRSTFKEPSGGKTVIKQGFQTLIEDVELIKKITKLPIKAAGGIKHLYQALKLVEAGVERIGTSAAKIICDEEQVNREYQEYKEKQK
ncbi:MAG: 2-deoxyribose-5-phosphate aldolase [Candidatus Hodarchaeota archaeon]